MKHSATAAHPHGYLCLPCNQWLGTVQHGCLRNPLNWSSGARHGHSLHHSSIMLADICKRKILHTGTQHLTFTRLLPHASLPWCCLIFQSCMPPSEADHIEVSIRWLSSHPSGKGIELTKHHDSPSEGLIQAIIGTFYLDQHTPQQAWAHLLLPTTVSVSLPFGQSYEIASWIPLSLSLHKQVRRGFCHASRCGLANDIPPNTSQGIKWQAIWK